MAAGNTMIPKEAAALLFAASNLAPVNKTQHMNCEQAKAVLEVALARLQDLEKENSKKPKGAK